MGKYINLTGRNFARLKILGIVKERGKRNEIKWLCKCACGNEIQSLTQDLKSGNTKSCGCLGKENRLKKNIGNKYGLRHGMAQTRFYNIWHDIKHRCLNQNFKQYKDYGGRGIKICEHWIKFENFRDDMYQSYFAHCEEFGEKETTIDRVDNNENYCKENCRWATKKEQVNNRSI